LIPLVCKIPCGSVGTWFLPATTAIGAGLYSVALYGGLVLFGGFLLYDTQKIIYRAETHPVYAMQPYDPVNKYVDAWMFTTVAVLSELNMVW